MSSAKHCQSFFLRFYIALKFKNAAAKEYKIKKLNNFF